MVRESPFLASITLATKTRIVVIIDIAKRVVKEVERLAKLAE